MSTELTISKKYQAFIILSICSLFLLYKYITQLFPSVISNELLKIYNFTGTEIAIMASSYYYSYSLLQIAAGYIIDRYNVRIPCFLAILCVSISILNFSYNNSFFNMCISRILMGAGAAFATILYMKCAALWTSPKTFGIVSSLLGTITMFGAALGSAPIAWYFNAIGWQKGLASIAIIGVLISFLALIFVSNEEPKISIAGYKLRPKNIKTVLFNKANVLLFLYAGTTFSPVLVLGGLWGNPFLIEKLKITNISASMLLFVMFIGFGFGSPIWAIIVNHIQKKKPLMHIANIISILSLAGIIYLNLPYKVVMILFFILGIAAGCLMLYFQLCREKNSIYLLGMAIAFVNASDGIFISVLETLIGYTLDLLKNQGGFTIFDYKIALSILPLCFILSSLSLLYLNEHEAKQQE